MALLEADVNFRVVKDFIGRISMRAIGQEVLQSLTPGQQIIKIVHDEMTDLMGGTETKLSFSSRPPTVFMAAGLQGAGKTTTVAKLGKTLVKQGRKPLLVACDIYRPAAIKQLQVLGEQTGIPVFTMGQNAPLDIARASVEHAKSHGHDTIILDTAGRLHVDDDMMNELIQIKEALQPAEILLVVDAMTGQDAVNVAENFNNQLGLTGVSFDVNWMVIPGVEQRYLSKLLPDVR